MRKYSFSGAVVLVGGALCAGSTYTVVDEKQPAGRGGLLYVVRP